jgi:HPt (histidine-containing phosphotransfer) domain-containing protein
MDTYLSKPFDADELFAVVERAAGEAAGPPEEDRDVGAASDGLDRAVALESVGGDGELLAEMARALLDESEDVERTLERAITDGRNDDVITTALELCRSLESLGAVAAARTAGDLAEAAGAGSSEQLRPILERLADGLRRAEGHIVAVAELGLGAWS